MSGSQAHSTSSLTSTSEDEDLSTEGLTFDTFEIGRVICGPLVVHGDDHHATTTTYEEFSDEQKAQYAMLARATKASTTRQGRVSSTARK